MENKGTNEREVPMTKTDETSETSESDEPVLELFTEE
jgi:hypothetical protein